MNFVKLIIICTTIIPITQSVRVCNTFLDYYNLLPINNNCYDNPDSDLNIEAIAGRWGFSVTQYNVTTEDGYILGMFRITSPNSVNQQPVLLAHGIMMNCLAYMTTGNKSLPNILANRGFDVWLANYRGTQFSRGHVSLDTNNPRYWNYSFHDMGTKDLPKMLELVNQETQTKAIYIGFSMGTTVSFIYSSSFPEMAQNYLLGIISLAPVAYLTNVLSVAEAVAQIWPLIEGPTTFISGGRIVLDQRLLIPLCITFPYQMKFCELVKTPIFGYSADQIDPRTYPVVQSNFMGGEAVATKVLTHYFQIIRSERFQQFDYGREGNLVEYGQEHPPIYQINQTSVPIRLFLGPGDILATTDNAKRFYRELPEDVRCGFNVVDYQTFSHVDFLQANDVVPLLTDNVLKSLDEITNDKCNN